MAYPRLLGKYCGFSREEMEANIKALNAIYDKAKKLECENQLIRAKYDTK
jgi:hypothetical protein